MMKSVGDRDQVNDPEHAKFHLHSRLSFALFEVMEMCFEI